MPHAVTAALVFLAAACFATVVFFGYEIAKPSWAQCRTKDPSQGGRCLSSWPDDCWPSPGGSRTPYALNLGRFPKRAARIRPDLGDALAFVLAVLTVRFECRCADCFRFELSANCAALLRSPAAIAAIQVREIGGKFVTHRKFCGSQGPSGR
jgi:hypothetical protein